MTFRDHILWTVAAVAVGVFLVATQAEATGGLAGLLHVGEESSLRPVIEQELGMVPVVPRGGHDGQMNYAMALDPWQIPDLGVETGYRYRRILYPAASSLGGWLGGQGALMGLVIVAIVGFALATVAVADIAAHMNWSRWSLLGVLASPGAWLSLRLLTSDSLALGLGMAGLALFLRRRHRPSIIALALAALAKDQALAVAAGIAVWLAMRKQGKLAAWYLVAPPIPLAVWSTSILLRGEPGFTPRQNLGIPFAGVIESIPRWSMVPLSDAVLSSVMAATALGGIALAWRHRNSWLGSQLIVWAALAFVASDWVWDYGNNVARAFSHLTAMVALGVAGLVTGRREPLPPPQQPVDQSTVSPAGS